MGLFTSTAKKVVSKREFKHNVRGKLRAKNLSAIDVDKVAMIFRADLDEPEISQMGIDANEITRGISWMRANTNIHKISSKEIDFVEQILKDEL